MARPKIHDKGLRDALLEGAARTVARGGVDGLVMRRLAAEHGTSTSAIYALFGGKQELIDAVIEAGAESLTAALLQVQETADPGADLRNCVLAYRAWALDHLDLYAVMFSGRFSVEGREALVNALIAPGLTKVVGTMMRLVTAGRLGATDLPEVASSIWASVHGAIELDRKVWRHLQTVDQRDAFFAHHVEAVERAWLLPPAGAGDPSARQAPPSAS